MAPAPDGVAVWTVWAAWTACSAGVSDVSPWLSLSVVGGSLAIVSTVCLRLLASGYKLRH